jgi:hypothetical protein
MCYKARSQADDWSRAAFTTNENQPHIFLSFGKMLSLHVIIIVFQMNYLSRVVEGDNG